MRFIPTKVHGVLDYLVGIVLITAPWMFEFSHVAKTGSSPQNLVPIILGIAAILYSLFTDYEFGVSRKIPMGIHLSFDFVSGVLLAASPWLFGFAHEVYLPHLILGLLEINAALFTKTYPGYRSQEADKRTATAM